MMAGRLLVIVGALLLTVGCVTTEVGDLSDKEEAARLNMELGLGYLRQGDYNEARIKLEKSLRDNPENSTAHRALGLVYERLNDNKGAEKQYRTAVSQAPDDADALNQLAAFLCVQGERAEALKLFDQALAVPLYMNRPLLLTNKATCVGTADLPQAESLLREALAGNPMFGPALLQLGQLSYLQKNYSQARAFVSRYMDAAPANSEVLWLGYRTEVAMQDSEGAKKYADQLLNRFPESEEARLLQEQRLNAG